MVRWTHRCMAVPPRRQVTSTGAGPMPMAPTHAPWCWSRRRGDSITEPVASETADDDAGGGHGVGGVRAHHGHVRTDCHVCERRSSDASISVRGSAGHIHGDHSALSRGNREGIGADRLHRANCGRWVAAEWRGVPWCEPSRSALRTFGRRRPGDSPGCQYQAEGDGRDSCDPRCCGLRFRAATSPVGRAEVLRILVKVRFHAAPWLMGWSMSTPTSHFEPESQLTIGQEWRNTYSGRIA